MAPFLVSSSRPARSLPCALLLLTTFKSQLSQQVSLRRFSFIKIHICFTNRNAPRLNPQQFSCQILWKLRHQQLIASRRIRIAHYCLEEWPSKLHQTLSFITVDKCNALSNKSKPQFYPVWCKWITHHLAVGCLQIINIGIKLLSPHADKHAGDISFTVCLFVCFCVCLFAGIL